MVKPKNCNRRIGHKFYCTNTIKKAEFSDAVRKRYQTIYGLAGRHSGVQICSWTKKALRGKGVCYKQKFYGIDCSRCCQMSPSLAWCQEKCIFCWRPSEWMKKTKMKKSEVESPEEIISSCIEQRKRLLAGIGGAFDVNKEAFRCAFNNFPSHWAISLSGEPTIYPRLGELVKALRKRKEVRSIFIVTNGQEPDRISQMANDNVLPTQFYLSLVAPDARLFRIINRPAYADGWERLNKTISLFPKLICRRVVRLTLIKGINDKEQHLKNFAKLLERSKTDFIEVKAYMFLGLSRQRLKKENMPLHEEIRQWSKKLLGNLNNYEIVEEDSASRIVLFRRISSRYEMLIQT